MLSILKVVFSLVWVLVLLKATYDDLEPINQAYGIKVAATPLVHYVGLPTFMVVD